MQKQGSDARELNPFERDAFVAVPLIWLEARKGPATTFDPADPPIALTGMQ